MRVTPVRHGYNPSPLVPLQSATRVEPYEILVAVGAGGMRDVWTARDSRLNRVIAVTHILLFLNGATA